MRIGTKKNKEKQQQDYHGVKLIISTSVKSSLVFSRRRKIIKGVAPEIILHCP